jgi:inosine-uridine nucleoside N-ribohydrolase
MRQIYYFLILLILALVRCSAGKEQDTFSYAGNFERVIFDTDPGGDIDDGGALAILHALASLGEIEILAIGVVNGHEMAVPYVHAVNAWYGRPDIPIGTIKGPAPYSRDEFMEPIVAEYPNTLTRDTAPDVVKLYRQVLASQPDRSVTLVAVGPCTNIYNLLHSPPDEHSPLTGVELVSRKVKFYGAGGNGGAKLPDGNPGWNYHQDLIAAMGELELMPTSIPMVFAGGSGRMLQIGSSYNNARPDHIMRRSYEEYYDGLAYNKVAADRQSWDQLRVLYACRPSARHLWDLSPPGNIEVDPQEPRIRYTPNPDRNKAYAYVSDYQAVQSMLTELMMYDPRDSYERVILDTDPGGDVDDGGALAVLHALASLGEIEILAIGVVNGHEMAVPYVHAVNTWYGRPDIPIGTIKGPAPYSRDEFMEPIVAEYPNTLTRDTAPDVVKLYRQVLASQPDRSVTLVAVGPCTNIYNLLNSPPDEHSPLTGVELVSRKVKFYGAGGNGDSKLPDGRPGFNYRQDLNAARGELELMPTGTPMVFAGGSGSMLKIGSSYNNARPDHIMRRSYEEYFDSFDWKFAYEKVAADRETWDQLRVLYACRPSARHLWDLSTPGNIEVDPQGPGITYTPNPDGNKAYAYVSNYQAVQSMLTELMMYDPRD